MQHLSTNNKRLKILWTTEAEVNVVAKQKFQGLLELLGDGSMLLRMFIKSSQLS